ncbi:HNH endonuclease signature motif containing protein [Xanthomonas campestris]
MSLYGCTTAVHIVMWRLHNGPILPKRQIDHMCNNRLCCNILHLQMVTNLKNQRLRAKRAKEALYYHV